MKSVVPGLALALLGCSNNLGALYSGGGRDAGSPSHSDAAPMRDAGSRAIAFKNLDCGACVTAGCAAELARCRADEPCNGWEGCIAACDGDGVCEHGCYAAAGKTNRRMGDIAACTLQHCFDACGGEGFVAAYSSACSDAYRTSCQQQARACAGDPGCLDFIRCMLGSNCVNPGGAGSGLDSGASGAIGANPGCVWQCGDATRFYEPVSTGADGGLLPNPTMGVALCLFFGDVSTKCELGSLGCAGHYSWPSAVASMTSIRATVLLNDAGYPEIPGAPMEGVPVRACRQQSTNCEEAFGPVTTDPAGRALLTLPTEVGGNTWYFEVTPRWPNGPPKLLFNTGRRLTEDTLFSLATRASDMSHLKEPGNHYSSVGPWSSNRGALLVETRGCDGFLAPNLRIQVDTEPDAGAPPLAYFTASYNLNRTPSSSTYGAYVASVEPGLVTVSAWKGDQLVARENVVVKADALTFLDWLEPLRTPGPGE